MSNGTPQPDVAIVGGGLTGLAAAAYVARAGRSTVVYERSHHIGGRAITNEHSGFLFNLGPHALYRAGAAARVLRELGVAYSGAKPPLDGKALHHGKLETLPTEPIGVLRTGLFDLGARIEWGRLFATATRIDAKAFDGLPLRDWVDAELSRPAVREMALASARLTTYVNDPARMSAGTTIRQLQLGLKGVDYLDGGWTTLVAGLRRAAEAAGATIVTGAKVETIAPGPEVRLGDGTSVEPAAVIVAAGPAVAAELVPASAALRRHADEAIPVRAATLDLGLRRLPRPDQRFVLGVDQPLYLSVHSGIASGLAPEGGAMVHVTKYLGPDDDGKASEGELGELLDLAQPGWRDAVVERHFLPNLVVVNDLTTADRGGLPGRPDVAVPDAGGVYLAGDWVGPEGWLSDASLASAERAAAAALAGRSPSAVAARALSSARA